MRISQGSVVTVLKLGGQNYKHYFVPRVAMASQILLNWLVSDRVIHEINKLTFLIILNFAARRTEVAVVTAGTLINREKKLQSNHRQQQRQSTESIKTEVIDV